MCLVKFPSNPTWLKPWLVWQNAWVVGVEIWSNFVWRINKEGGTDQVINLTPLSNVEISILHDPANFLV